MFCLTTCNEASPPMPTCQNLRIPTCGRPAAEENQEGSRGRQSYALYIYTVFLYDSAGTKKATLLQHLIYLRCLLPHRCGMCYRQEPTPHARPKGLLDLAKNVLENRCCGYCIDIRCKLVQ